MRSLLLCLVSSLILLAGCQPDLGECDIVAARAVVYDQEGFPAYEGQALLQVSCGNGAFCHSEGASPTSRLGAPAELDFDMALATAGDGAAATATERLRVGQLTTYDWRHEIFSQVEGETMPPYGEATVLALANVPRFGRADGTRLDPIDTFGGLDTLKNWLACGSPVVERTTPHPDGFTSVGAVIPALAMADVEPTFSSIYQRVLLPRCGNSCHGPGAGSQLTEAVLDLSETGAAYTNLLNVAAMGSQCGTASATLVVPGDPTNSLLLQKLEGTHGCGAAMPLDGAQLPNGTIPAISQWITAGAAND